MGRPTKFTPEVQERICEALRLGATHEMAAHYGGICISTFATWRARYPAFLAAVKAAEARAAVGWLAKIEKAASEGAWQAAAWKLERRYPEQFGRSVRVDIEARVRHMAERLGLDPEEAVLEAARLLAEAALDDEVAGSA